MTLAEKLRALAYMAATGREEDAYQGIDQIQRERAWPEWLKSVAADVDGPKVEASKDRPINAEAKHG